VDRSSTGFLGAGFLGAGFLAMAREYVIDEALGDIRVGRGLSIAKDDIIDHRQGSHQLGPRTLGQQRPGGIGNFDHQQAARLARLSQTPNMFSQERIEMAGYPSGGVILQPLLDLVERDDFRSGIQKQSLTVMCRFRAWVRLCIADLNRGRGEAGC
jgi:hypothetical protein